MNIRASSAIQLLAGLCFGLAGGLAAGQEAAGPASGFYTEPQLIEILKKVFLYWRVDKYEKLIFVASDGQVVIFGNGDPNRVSNRVIVTIPHIIKTLARRGLRVCDITNVIHNHNRKVDFALADIAACETLRKAGFTGRFQIFYPKTNELKTLERTR